MKTKYYTSMYGIFVYFLYFLIFTPLCLAAVGVALFPTPYNEPNLFGKIVLVTLGGGGALRTVSFTRNILWFIPRITIGEEGIKYNGFYLHTFMKWKDISAVEMFEIRGFSFMKISFKKKRLNVFKSFQLDVSGMSPGKDHLLEEVKCYFENKYGI